ncbi:hypothetical protein L6452_22734 [Arctium lappa]|uniref:Uncharacterized protein n=1 Tax=Arctium lappa TaxID=4217 RepID=A0ACB9AZS2_ARCLA|nr:hypothetical protein L6452_22734 [Arctium lappa]
MGWERGLGNVGVRVVLEVVMTTITGGGVVGQAGGGRVWGGVVAVTMIIVAWWSDVHLRPDARMFPRKKHKVWGLK